MEAKTVSLDPQAYALLKRSKKEGETFSDAVKHLAGKRRSMMDLAGTWSNVPAGEWERRREARRKLEADRSKRVRAGWE